MPSKRPEFHLNKHFKVCIWSATISSTSHSAHRSIETARFLGFRILDICALSFRLAASSIRLAGLLTTLCTSLFEVPFQWISFFLQIIFQFSVWGAFSPLVSSEFLLGSATEGASKAAALQSPLFAPCRTKRKSNENLDYARLLKREDSQPMVEGVLPSNFSLN